MDDANLTTNMLRFAGIKPENRRPFLERIVGSDSLSGFANVGLLGLAYVWIHY